MTLSHLRPLTHPLRQRHVLRNAHPHCTVNTCSQTQTPVHTKYAPLSPCTIPTLKNTDPCIQMHICPQYISCTPRKIHTHPNAHSLHTPTCTDVHTLTFRHTQTHIYREKCTLTCMLVGTFTAHTHELRSEPLDADSELRSPNFLQQLRNEIWFQLSSITEPQQQLSLLVVS